MPLSRAMNKSFLLLVFLSIVLGCGGSSNSDNSNSIPLETGFNPKCTTYNATITIYPSPYEGTLRRCNTSDRQFYVYLPEDYSEVGSSYPAMFSLHGYTSTALTNMSYTGFMKQADINDFVVIYPQGLVHETKGGTHWNTDEIGPGNSVNSIEFLESVLDWVGQNYNIDLNRFYSAGMSNGGFMSYHLACNITSKISAIASVTGSMSVFSYDNCNAQPTSVMQIHGSVDTVVPYDGTVSASGVGFKGIEDVMEFWSSNNICNIEPSIETLPDISANGVSGTHRIYSECANDVEVQLYFLEGVGHDWPENYEVDGNGGTGLYDINSAEIIWTFFNNFDQLGKRQ
jgi:polyhydroxybutyrate depolymerase